MASVAYVDRGGTGLAYQLVGEGPPDLLFVPGFVSHLDVAWEEPRLRSFLERLAGFSRLIWFDKRGTGLSDPIGDVVTVDDRVADIGAVADAAGADRVALFGISEGAALCAIFAARWPERVSHLVLFAGFACLVNRDDYEIGWSAEFFEQFLDGLASTRTSGAGAEVANPSIAGDARYRQWFSRYLRAAASPAVMRKTMQSNADIDIRPLLAEIQAPTLILHRQEEKWLSRQRHLPGRTYPWCAPRRAARRRPLAMAGRRQRRSC